MTATAKVCIWAKQVAWTHHRRYLCSLVAGVGVTLLVAGCEGGDAVSRNAGAKLSLSGGWG
jgi:hypothetical protein